MSKFCDLRLVDFVTHTQKCNKPKQVTSTEHDQVEKKPKRNRKERFFSNTAFNLNMPSIAERIRNKSKSRVASKTAKRNIKISHQQSNAAVKRGTNSGSLKLNTSVEACESDKKIELLQPKFGCQVIKKRVSVGAEQNMSSQKKPKTNLNIDTNKHISSNSENVYKIKKGHKNKKNTKRRTHQFWESNLTGARRVSKRLTNQKFKNKNLIDPDTASEKSIITISNRNSNQEKKSSTQRLVFLNIPQKNFKISRKKTVSKPPSTYCTVDHKKQLYPKVESNKKEVLKQEMMNVADLLLPKVLNDFCDTEKLKSNVSSFCGRESEVEITSISAAVSIYGNEEEVSSSSVDQEEGVQGFSHLDLKMKEIVDLYQSVEENGISANKTGYDFSNSTEAVKLDDIQIKECEENTEIIIVDVETDETKSSFTPEKSGNSTISFEFSEDKYQEKTTGPTKVLTSNNLVPSAETHINILEFNTDSSSERSEVVEKTDNNTSKEEINLMPVNDVCDLENIIQSEENVQLD